MIYCHGCGGEISTLLKRTKSYRCEEGQDTGEQRVYCTYCGCVFACRPDHRGMMWTRSLRHWEWKAIKKSPSNEAFKAELAEIVKKFWG